MRFFKIIGMKGRMKDHSPFNNVNVSGSRHFDYCQAWREGWWGFSLAIDWQRAMAKGAHFNETKEDFIHYLNYGTISYGFISYHCCCMWLYGFNSLTLTSSALLLTRTERHSAIFQEYPGFLIHWHTTSHKQLSNAYETKNWRKQSIKAERITSQKTLILNFRRTT